MLKRKKLTVFILIILVSGIIFGFFLSRIYLVPILMYHSVNPQSTQRMNRLIVSPETFDKQMRFLKEKRYNVISLEELAGLIRDKKRIPSRTVVITFDDGFKDNYIHAFPVLKKYGLPATIFLITTEIGRHDRLNWGEIKEMRDSGIITFGSHTLGPVPLLEIKSEEELRKQIFDSRKVLEAKLSSAINTFSYPGGGFDRNIRQMVVDAGYKAAVTTSPGRQYPDDDVFGLKRIRISENAKNLLVFWFETSGFYNFIREHRHK